LTITAFLLTITTIITITTYKTIKYAEVDRRGWTDIGVNGYGKYKTMGDGVLFPVVVGVGIISLIIGLIAGTTSVGMMLNPEYYAIKEILNVVKGAN